VNALLLLLLAGLTHATRSFSTHGEPGSSGTSLALGYLLMTGYFAGRIVTRFGLPQLTGYLLIGVLVGPSGLALVSRSMVHNLSLVNGIAIAMIALTGGVELEFSKIKPLARSVLWITVFGVLGTVVWLALAIWFGRPLFPFLASLGTTQALSATLVLAVVVVAQSPSIVVALRDEMRAEGPVARTVLAVVVLGDLVVILMFALASAITRATFGAGADVLHTLLSLAWSIGGSLAVGGVLGALLVLYLRKVKVDAALLLLAVMLSVAEVGGRLGLDPLLVALAAGAFVRNASNVGDELHDQLQLASLPVYVLFFCLAGASLHASMLQQVWAPTLLICVVRAAGLLAGTRLAGRVAAAPAPVQRYAGYGLLPQAGLAQALALLFTHTFPEFGEQAATLVLSVVMVNVLLPPIAYRFALIRSGEAGRESERASWSALEPEDERGERSRG
jgi:Kef-type K+ transport system membrane component KefB